MNYEEMSDLEINKAVAKIIYPDSEIQSVVNNGDSVMAYRVDNGILKIDSFMFSPVESMVDAWPIINENKISMLSHRLDFTLYSFGQEHQVNHENPLRAAMIVFLMMKDAE